jgi:hypothetical protein
MKLDELDVPWSATITAFSELDQVGRMQVAGGEELRFGRSACEGLAPTVGMGVFVTIVGDHPLGGKKAFKVRITSTTEQQVRAAFVEQAAHERARAAEDAAKRLEVAGPMTSADAIIKRVMESVHPEEDYNDDIKPLYDLVDDLELVGRSPSHVRAILQGIANSHPMAHFGSPGPLVHYVEKFEGFEVTLFEIAASAPTFHFLRMLARCVNGDLATARALAILVTYAESRTIPEGLRLEAAKFVQSRKA